MKPALRNRALAAFLQENGVKEPEREHIALAEKLVLSNKPSAKAGFPGGITVSRNYGRLEVIAETQAWETAELPCPGSVELPALNLRVHCLPAKENINQPRHFTVAPKGRVVVRTRQAGDEMRLSGGTKQLKKLFIDRKIPASRRAQIPVVADEDGVLGVCGFGPNLDRTMQAQPCVEIYFETIVQET